MLTENKTPLRVALYIRVSTDDQVEKFGLDLQRAALDALIKSKPNDLVFAGENHVYIDDGISGTLNIIERPAFARLVEDITNAPVGEKPFDTVAVYKIDRFARKLKILLNAIDLFEENGIGFISANESIDTSTPFGRAMLGIIGVIAELEIETTKKRTRDGRDQAFEKGTVLGSNAPYGFSKTTEKKYKILEEEAKVVEEIFTMFVHEGKSLEYIARYLTEHMVLSPEASAIKHEKRKGGTKKKEDVHFWRSGRIRHLLRDPIYNGEIAGNRKKAGKDLPRSQWKISPTRVESIVDIVTFEKAQNLLNESSHYKKEAKDNHIYLLGGLLKCDCCYDPKPPYEDRAHWHGERKNTKNGLQYYYKCPHKNKAKTATLCGALPLPATEVENYFIEYAKKLIKNPLAVFNHQNNLISKQNTIRHLKLKETQLVKLIAAIPDRKKRLKELRTDGIIDRATHNRDFEQAENDRIRFTTDLDKIKREISTNTLSKGYSMAFEAFAKAYSEMLKTNSEDRELLYTVLHELIDEIVIYTRPIKSTDAIAGKKRDGQEIPDRFHIKLKLPQDILAQIATQNIPEDQLNNDNVVPPVPVSSGSKTTSSAR